MGVAFTDLLAGAALAQIAMGWLDKDLEKDTKQLARNCRMNWSGR